MPRSTQTYGIDTSVFLRLLTGLPEKDFKATSDSLSALFALQPAAELFVSNQVIGESYIALQYHYELSKAEARLGILQFLQEGIVAPLNGAPVLEILGIDQGAGLMDRLIIQDYQARQIGVLTNDKKMAQIPGAVLLPRVTKKGK